MPREGPNLTRRRDINSALKRAKPGDLLGLEDLALVWGVAKARFVTVRNDMADFPAPQPGTGNSYLYPALKALKAMLAYEERHDAAAKARQARTDAILGRTKRGRVGKGEGPSHTPNELATLARLAADVESREREQGLYAPISEVMTIAGDVFGEISDFCRELSNRVDPHGALPPGTRALIDSSASDLLLKLHKRMKGLLEGDAGSTGNRKPAGSAGAPRTRR